LRAEKLVTLGHRPAESKPGEKAAGPRSGVRKLVTFGRKAPRSGLIKTICNHWHRGHSTLHGCVSYGRII
jgi:hypothetical protein